jgi:hypothetical protein
LSPPYKWSQADSLTRSSQWYHTCRLVLHRPFIPFVRPEPGPSSHDVCVDAVEKVFSLVALYEERFGLRRLSHSMTFIVFQASIFQVAQSTSEVSAVANAAQAKLELALGWLGQIARSYPMTKDYLDVLQSLRKLCQRPLKEGELLASAIASRHPSRRSSPVPSKSRRASCLGRVHQLTESFE